MQLHTEICFLQKHIKDETHDKINRVVFFTNSILVKGQYRISGLEKVAQICSSLPAQFYNQPWKYLQEAHKREL